MRTSNTTVILALLVAVVAGSSQGMAGRAADHGSTEVKPAFLVQARKNHADAQAALQAEQDALTQLVREEAKLRQASLAKTGSWIEPAEWWQKKQILKEKIAQKKEAVRRAQSKLSIAEIHARATAESAWSKKHKPSWFRSWWQW